MVVTPVDATQGNLASGFLKKAKENLLFPGYHYEIQGVCEDLKFIASPDFSTQSSQQSVISSDLFKWVGESSRSKKCNASAEKTIDSLIGTLSDYLKQRKEKDIIIFAQIPWEGSSEKAGAYSSLKEKASKISGKERVKKIYLFGVSGSGKKIVDIFESFGSDKVETTGTSLSEIDNMLTGASKFIKP